MIITEHAGDQPEEGEVASSDTISNKVHISGLDLLTTNDIKNFVGDHYSLEKLKRVEWINDTSANLLFDSGETAAAALQALSAEDSSVGIDSVPAKQLATHPNADLRVRLSTTQDVKLPGAKDRSRFYLLNPEYDPDLRPREGKRHQRRDGRGNEGAKRRRNDASIYSRRSSLDEPAFNVDLYDDDGGEKAEPKPMNGSRPRRSQDLFSGKDQGRLRDRSASPATDGDGKYGFEENTYRRTARRRSVSPQRRGGKGQELFPEKSSSTTKSSNGVKELFPSRGPDHPNHVADIMGKSSLADRIEHPSSIQKRDLFSRISGGPGRLNSDDGDLEGFSILGASKDRTENPLAKELFPMKMKNNGQDLFDGRVKGRASQRRRAEDLF